MVKKMTTTLEEKDTENAEPDNTWIDPSFVKSAKDGEVPPARTDPEWSAWLLTQFAPNEVVRGEREKDVFPKVHGLRRLARIFVGDIVESVCECIKPPSLLANGQIDFCSFIHRIKFLTKDNAHVTYSDAADVCPLNSNEDYSVYPSALAVTRAEARVLRKALGLEVCSAEELKKGQVKNKFQPKEREVNTDTVIPKNVIPEQKAFIKTQCQKLKVNPWCLLNSGETKYKDLNDVPYKEATEFCKILGEWLRNEKTMDKFLDSKKITKLPFNVNWEKEVLNA